MNVAQTPSKAASQHFLPAATQTMCRYSTLHYHDMVTVVHRQLDRQTGNPDCIAHAPATIIWWYSRDMKEKSAVTAVAKLNCLAL